MKLPGHKLLRVRILAALLAGAIALVTTVACKSTAEETDVQSLAATTCSGSDCCGPVTCSINPGGGGDDGSAGPQTCPTGDAITQQALADLNAIIDMMRANCGNTAGCNS